MLENFDHFIFAFFAIEMIIKMMAMGVWGKETYLADHWNRLDCFIVLAGWVGQSRESWLVLAGNFDRKPLHAKYFTEDIQGHFYLDMKIIAVVIWES